MAASGGAERFTQFLADELIPTIERTYPTSGHRTLIGHSYAGLFTIHTLIHHPDLFRNYVAIDPSLDWDDQASSARPPLPSPMRTIRARAFTCPSRTKSCGSVTR